MASLRHGGRNAAEAGVAVTTGDVLPLVVGFTRACWQLRVAVLADHTARQYNTCWHPHVAVLSQAVRRGRVCLLHITRVTAAPIANQGFSSRKAL